MSQTKLQKNNLLRLQIWYTSLHDPYIHQLSYMFSCTTHLVLMGPIIKYVVDAQKATKP
jgi:hypothetical protein